MFYSVLNIKDNINIYKVNLRAGISADMNAAWSHRSNRISKKRSSEAIF